MLVQHLNLLCNKCLTAWPRPKTLLDKQKLQTLLRGVLRKLKNIFGLTQAKNVGRALFLDVDKRSDILLDKKIFNFGQTMFDRLARALDYQFTLILL